MFKVYFANKTVLAKIGEKVDTVELGLTPFTSCNESGLSEAIHAGEVYGDIYVTNYNILISITKQPEYQKEIDSLLNKAALLDAELQCPREDNAQYEIQMCLTLQRISYLNDQLTLKKVASISRRDHLHCSKCGYLAGDEICSDCED